MLEIILPSILVGAWLIGWGIWSYNLGWGPIQAGVVGALGAGLIALLTVYGFS